jgi:hypothetical protein
MTRFDEVTEAAACDPQVMDLGQRSRLALSGVRVCSISNLSGPKAVPT